MQGQKISWKQVLKEKTPQIVDVVNWSNVSLMGSLVSRGILAPHQAKEAQILRGRSRGQYVMTVVEASDFSTVKSFTEVLASGGYDAVTRALKTAMSPAKVGGSKVGELHLPPIHSRHNFNDTDFINKDRILQEKSTAAGIHQPENHDIIKTRQKLVKQETKMKSKSKSNDEQIMTSRDQISNLGLRPVDSKQGKQSRVGRKSLGTGAAEPEPTSMTKYLDKSFLKSGQALDQLKKENLELKYERANACDRLLRLLDKSSRENVAADDLVSCANAINRMVTRLRYNLSELQSTNARLRDKIALVEKEREEARQKHSQLQAAARKLDGMEKREPSRGPELAQLKEDLKNRARDFSQILAAHNELMRKFNKQMETNRLNQREIAALRIKQESLKKVSTENACRISRLSTEMKELRRMATGHPLYARK